MVTFQAMRKGLIGFGQFEKGVHFSTNEKRGIIYVFGQ